MAGSSYGFATLGRVVLQFVARTDEVDRALAKSSKGISEFAVHIAKLGTAFIALGATSSQVFSRMLGPLNTAINTAREFQTDLNRITTIMESGGTAIDKYQKGLLRISRTMGVDLKDATNALYEAISGGIPEGNALQVLEEGAKLARIGMTDLNTATQALRTVLNAYHIDLAKSTDATRDLQEVSSVLFNTVDFAAFSFEELSKHMGRVLPLANLAGVSLKEATSALAAMNRNGLNVSQSVTGLSNVLISFIKPTQKSKDAAKELSEQMGLTGDAAFELSGAFIAKHGIVGAMEKLIQVTRGNVDEMGKIFSRKFGLQGVAALTVDQLKNMKQAIEELTISDLRKEFETMQDVTFRLNQTMANFQTILEQAGRTQLPALAKILDVVNDKLEMFNKYLEDHPTFAGNFAAMYAGVALVGKGLSDILVQLGFISFALISLRPVIVGALVVPMEAAAASFAEAVRRSEVFRASVQAIGNAFRSLSGPASDWFGLFIREFEKFPMRIYRQTEIVFKQMEGIGTSARAFYSEVYDSYKRSVAAREGLLRMMKQELDLTNQLLARRHTAEQVYTNINDILATMGTRANRLEFSLQRALWGATHEKRAKALLDFLRDVRVSIKSVDLERLLQVRQALVSTREFTLVAQLDDIIQRIRALDNLPSISDILRRGGTQSTQGRAIVDEIKRITESLRDLRSANLASMESYFNLLAEQRGGYSALTGQADDLIKRISEVESAIASTTERMNSFATAVSDGVGPSFSTVAVRLRTVADLLGDDVVAALARAQSEAAALLESMSARGVRVTSDMVARVRELVSSVDDALANTRELAVAGARTGINFEERFRNLAILADELSISINEAGIANARVSAQQIAQVEQIAARSAALTQTTTMRIGNMFSVLTDAVQALTSPLRAVIGFFSETETVVARLHTVAIGAFKSMGIEITRLTSMVVSDTIAWGFLIEAVVLVGKTIAETFRLFGDIADIDLGFTRLSDTTAKMAAQLEAADDALTLIELRTMSVLEQQARSAAQWRVAFEFVEGIGRLIERWPWTLSLVVLEVGKIAQQILEGLINILTPGKGGTALLGGLIDFAEEKIAEIQSDIFDGLSYTEIALTGLVYNELDARTKAYDDFYNKVEMRAGEAAKKLRESTEGVTIDATATLDEFNSALSELNVGEFTEEQFAAIKDIAEQTNSSILDSVGLYHKAMKSEFATFDEDRERLFKREADFAAFREETALSIVRGAAEEKLGVEGEYAAAVESIEDDLLGAKASNYEKDSENLREKIANDLGLFDDYHAKLMTDEQRLTEEIEKTKKQREEAIAQLRFAQTEEDYNRIVLFIHALDQRMYGLRQTALDTKTALAAAAGDEETVQAWQEFAEEAGFVALQVEGIGTAAEGAASDVEMAAQATKEAISGIPEAIRDSLSGLSDNLKVRVASSLGAIDDEYKGFLESVSSASEEKSKEVAKYLEEQAKAGAEISAQAIADIIDLNLEKLKSDETARKSAEVGEGIGTAIADNINKIMADSEKSPGVVLEESIAAVFTDGGTLWDKITGFFGSVFSIVGEGFKTEFLADWITTAVNTLTASVLPGGVTAGAIGTGLEKIGDYFSQPGDRKALEDQISARARENQVLGRYATPQDNLREAAESVISDILTSGNMTYGLAVAGMAILEELGANPELIFFLREWRAKTRLTDLPQYAKGGMSGGGVALVGEEGPELVTLPAGAYVHDAKTTKKFIGTFAGGGYVGSGRNYNANSKTTNRWLEDMIENALIRLGVTPGSPEWQRLFQYYLAHPEQLGAAEAAARPVVVPGIDSPDATYGIDTPWFQAQRQPLPQESYGAYLNRMRGGMSYGERQHQSRLRQGQSGQYSYMDQRSAAIAAYVSSVSDDGNLLFTTDGEMYRLGNTGVYGSLYNYQWYQQQAGIANDPNKSPKARHVARQSMDMIARQFGTYVGTPEEIRRALSGQSLGLSPTGGAPGTSSASGGGTTSTYSNQELAYMQFMQQAQASFQTQFTSAEGVRFDRAGNAMLPDGRVLRNLGNGIFEDIFTGERIQARRSWYQTQYRSTIQTPPMQKGRGDFSTSTFNGEIRQFIGDPHAMAKYFKGSKSYKKALGVYEQLEAISGRYGYSPDKLPYGVHRVYDRNGQLDTRATNVTSKLSKMSDREVMKFDQLMQQFLALLKKAIDEIGGVSEYAKRQGGGGRVIRSGRVDAAMATGGYVRKPDSRVLVGEEGPELVVLPAGARVFNANSTGAMLRRRSAARSIGSGMIGLSAVSGLGGSPTQASSVHAMRAPGIPAPSHSSTQANASPKIQTPSSSAASGKKLLGPTYNKQVPEYADMAKLEARIRSAPLSVLESFVREIMPAVDAERVLSFKEWTASGLADYILGTIIPQTHYPTAQYFHAFERADKGGGSRSSAMIRGKYDAISRNVGRSSGGGLPPGRGALSGRGRSSFAPPGGGNTTPPTRGTSVLDAYKNKGKSVQYSDADRERVIGKIGALSEPVLKVLLGLLVGPDQAATICEGKSRSEIVDYIINTVLADSKISTSALDSYIDRANQQVLDYPVGTLPPSNERGSLVQPGGGVFGGAAMASVAGAAVDSGLSVSSGLAASAVGGASGPGGTTVVQNFNVGYVRTDEDIIRIANFARTRADRIRRSKS